MKESILQRSWIRWTSTGIVLAIMIAIFVFSGQGQEQSEGLSFPIGDAVIGSGTLDAVKEKVEESGESFWLFVQRLVRKLAHVVIFMALGGSLLICLESWTGKRKLNGLWSAVIGTLYAASDEWHQSMVPGRSGSVEDTLLDAAGVIAGVLFAALAVWLIKRRMKKKAEKSRC